MKKLTQFQKDEILGLLEVRRETIEKDPDSADEFETIESLNELKRKIEAGSVDYTEAERKWMIEEFETRVEIFHDFQQPEEHMSRIASIKSLRQAIEHLTTP